MVESIICLSRRFTMKNSKYTEKQLKIISGEIPLESVKGQTASALYRKALANNDTELAERAHSRMLQSKENVIQKNRDSVRIRQRQQRDGIFQWKQPKSNEYTEHQKQIVRGEIPFEKVHTNELIRLYQKAYNVEDYALSETVLSLICDRREASIEKKKERKRKERADYFEGEFDEYDRNSFLSKRKQAILNGVIPLEECAEENIIEIIDILNAHDDKENLKVAELLLSYKRTPSLLYVTTDHREAIDLLEELLQLPIRRPGSWFEDDNKQGSD